jgi:small basic protein (TIGR04137 family)
MSIHKSLKTKGKLVRLRNVLNRHERLEILLREGRWDGEKDSPYGLPKVRIMKIKKRGKKKAKDEEKADAK